MAELGSNTTRIFITMQDWQAGDFTAAKLDAVLRHANAHGIRLLISLFDGYRKYPAPGWDSWPSLGTEAANIEGAYLQAVIAPFAGDPRILAWDLYNEPDIVSNHEWMWSDHAGNRLNWLRRIAATVRAMDGNHPLTVGLALAAAIPVGGHEGVLSIVDFASFHYYSRNYPGRSVAAVLREVHGWTNRPILIEEAGQATAGDAVSSDEAARAFYANTLPASAQAAGLLGWTLHDFPQHGGGSEGYYGLYRADDTAKLAATAFRDSLRVAPFASISLPAPAAPANDDCE